MLRPTLSGLLAEAQIHPPAPAHFEAPEPAESQPVYPGPCTRKLPLSRRPAWRPQKRC